MLYRMLYLLRTMFSFLPVAIRLLSGCVIDIACDRVLCEIYRYKHEGELSVYCIQHYASKLRDRVIKHGRDCMTFINPCYLDNVCDTVPALIWGS